MKYEILKGFRDKHTGQIYKPGEVAEFTDERVEEINSVNSGLIKKIPTRRGRKKSEQD